MEKQTQTQTQKEMEVVVVPNVAIKDARKVLDCFQDSDTEFVITIPLPQEETDLARTEQGGEKHA